MKYYFFSLKFDREKTVPVTKEEYEKIKPNPSLALIRIENDIDDLKDSLPKETVIKWPLFFLLLFLGILCYYIGRFYLSNESYGSYFVVFGALLTLLTIIMPIRAAILAPMHTNLEFKLKKQQILSYYEFHKEMIKTSDNYNHYLNLNCKEGNI